MADNTTPDLARLRAVLMVNGRTLTQLAGAVGVSERHLAGGLGGMRPISRAVGERMRSDLGENDWRFVTGQTDTLTAPALRRAVTSQNARAEAGGRPVAASGTSTATSQATPGPEAA